MTKEQANTIQILVEDFECSARQIHRIYQRIYVEQKDWYINETLKKWMSDLCKQLNKETRDRYFKANIPSGNQEKGFELIQEAEILLNVKFV